MKKSVLGNFTKFTGKRLRPATLLKKRLWHSCFPVNFAKLLRTPFLQNTSERLLLDLFLEFEPLLGKSEKFNNKGMKENKAFRIPFMTKKQLKGRQALHRIFLKAQYKVYRGASILYCNASFSDVPSFSKMSPPPG